VGDIAPITLLLFTTLDREIPSGDFVNWKEGLDGELGRTISYSDFSWLMC